MYPQLLLITLFTVTREPVQAGSSQMTVHLCTRNETVTVQLLTKQDDSGLTCQCQASQSGNPSIKEDYVHTPGIGSHKLHTDAKTWNDARKICNDEGGHLAIINSQAEETVLVDILKRAEPTIKNSLHAEEALLGIHDVYNEGEWVTIFGESLYSTGYSRWSPTYWGGQPDNFEKRQNCGALINEGAMDDVDCREKFAFFCELPLAC